jgi:hypothetical protein
MSASRRDFLKFGGGAIAVACARPAAAAALAVGASGGVLGARDHRLATAASAAARHEVAEER